MATFIFVEQFGHGKAAKRARRVNEIDFTDHDSHIYRLEILTGHTAAEVAQDFFHILLAGRPELKLYGDGRDWNASTI